MALTIQDILGQLSSLFSGGTDQGATSYAAPELNQRQTVGTTTNFNTGGIQTPGSGFGMNLGTAGLALGGLQSLNGLLQGNKAMKLANDQFDFTKDVTNTNLNNSIQSYNTSLEDRLRSRGVVEGKGNSAVEDEINRKRLTR